jgi:hypothetical protein
MNRSTANIAGLLLALVLLSSIAFYEYAQNASLSATNSRLLSELSNSSSFSNVVTIASNVTVVLSPCQSSCASSENSSIASFTAEHPGFVLVTATYSLPNTTTLEPLIIGATGSFDCSKFITQQLYSLYPCNGGFPVYFGPAPVVIPVLPGKVTIIAFNFGNATVSSSFSVKYYSW